MNIPESLRPVLLVARRELDTKLRNRAFLIGTAVTLVVLAGYVLLQSALSSDAERATVGLSGQSISYAKPLADAAGKLGYQLQVREVSDVAAAQREVREDELDALVSGASAAPTVLVKDELQPELRGLLTGLVQQQVLAGRLAADTDLDPREVLSQVASANLEVTVLEPRDADYGQRMAVGLVVAVLLYMALLIYGQMVAQGVVEEKSSRVVELLLSSVRPWQLLAGKIVGLGTLGLIQFTIVGVVGLIMAVATGVLTISGAATGTLIWGLIWYLLGYFLYATVFAAAGSLVSRQEDAQAVLTPVLMVIALGFVVGFNVLINDPTGTTALVMSLLPPFAPMLMPARIALGDVAAWELAVALVLTLAGIALLTWLGGRIYQNAVLRSGSRVSLREALGR
jgi:ABC-2 type transport system permease protein